MKKKMVVFSLTCLLIAGLQAQSLTQPRFLSHLDSFIQELMEKIPVIPAITIAIVNEKGTVFNKAYGWANKEAGIKADVNTAFYIGSSTKSFTALVAVLLDQEKKILLDSPMKNYFSNISFRAGISDKVTIRSLLTHTSGLENGHLTFLMTYGSATGRQDMLRVLGNATRARSEPGVFLYDNLGYNIYGLALQEQLGMQWQDVLQDRICKPLGMKHTTPYISAAKKNNWILAVPYQAYGANGLQKIYLEKEDHTMQSAGGLISTSTDLATWLQVQINSGKINNRQLISEQAIKALHTGAVSFDKGSNPFPGAGQYGLGWSISRYRDEKVLHQSGGFPGFRSHVSFMPGKKTGVAILVNEATIGSSATDMLATLVYDWITGADIIEPYAKKLDELETSHTKAVESTQRSFAERAARVSQLSMPLANYVGTYQHSSLGNMEVTIVNNALGIKFGSLRALSTPFTQKESVRVELFPGSGQSILFKADDTGKIASLVYDGVEFKRVP